MYDNALAALTARLTILERRWRCCRLLAIGMILLILLLVGVGAQTAPTSPQALQATGLDIVNEHGQVLLRLGPEPGGGAIRVWNSDSTLSIVLYATAKGGRLEVLNAEGQEIFSAGMSPHSNLPSLWERQQRVVEQQQQEITRQHQDIDRLNRDLRDTANVPRVATDLDQQRRELDRLRRDVESQRRTIDAQRRDIGTLERHIRSLERR